MDDLNQAKNLIARSNNILILPPRDIDGDSLASSLALFFTLKKIGKNVNILIDEIPDKFKFLQDDWRPQNTEDFVISVDTANKEISKMRYERNANDLKIYLTVNGGKLKNRDISFPAVINYPLDLLVTIGVKSLNDLGEVFKKNSRLFSEKPILNIGRHASNENFGEVNLADDTSSAEILTNLISLMESEDEAFLDKNIATYLLAGLIFASQNFRHPSTKPKSFETCALLIERGGDHQKIIRHIYKQKSVSQINLLGRILEKLTFNEPKQLYSASLTEKDFRECQASLKDLSFVAQELKLNFRYLPNFLLLWQSHNPAAAVRGMIYSPKKDLIEKILQNYSGASKGEGALFSCKESDLDSARKNLFNII